jgi:hypothetical protein
MTRLERDAQRICIRFGLRYRVLEPERSNVKSRYGVCFSDGTIRIRLRHATTGRPLKYSSLVSTLCHELAHLKHFNHGLRFRAYYAQILEWCRAEGIYRPGLPASTERPAEKLSRRSGNSARDAGEKALPVQGVLPVFAVASPKRRPSRAQLQKKANPEPSSQLELFG